MWIPSKLTIPAPLHKSIQRTHILKELNTEYQYKLVLFQSPTGYGKTTAAAQWLSHYQHVGWFSIDDTDNEPLAFAHYFISALNHATQNCCVKSFAMVQKNQFVSLESLFTLVLNEIIDWQKQSYLVLDDYHLIKDDKIHAAMNRFIKHIPKNFTIVITSRSQPPIGIANLRIRRQLLEIDDFLLAFDNEEAHLFLSQFNQKSLDKSLSYVIRDQVEGWPSAMQLIALNSERTGNLPKLTAIQLTHIWDYLAEEVFEKLDQQSREFLMQCSIFSHFNHELIFFITHNQHTLNRLNHFHKNGLMLCLTDPKEHWYRFHNLFATFLSHQRKRLMADQEANLRIRAVQAWIKINKLEQALSCAMQACENHLVIEVLLNHGWQLFNHGDFKLLNEALQNLKKEELFSHSSLVFLKAWLAQAQHRYNEAGEQLTLGIRELTKRNISLSAKEQGEYYSLMAQVAINQNQTERALELSEKAFEHLPANSYHPRIVATSVVGEVHYCLGQLNRAFPLMQQTEKLARQYELYHQVLWALLQQAEIDIARGLMNSSLERLNKAQELVERYHLEQLPLYEFMLRLRSALMWNLNRIDEAEMLANQSVNAMSYYDKSKSLPAFTQLAKNALLKGELVKSQQYLHECEKLLELNECHLDWRANVYMTQLILWQLKEDKPSTTKWLEDAEVPSFATNHFSQLQFRNIARAHYILEQYDEALGILYDIYEVSQRLDLVTNNQFNLALLAVVLDKHGQKKQSEEILIKAIQLSTKTGITACFYQEPVTMLPILNRAVRCKELDRLVKHQIKTLVDSMSHRNAARALYFDESIVKKLLASDKLPDAIRTSPLTHREWQVMGLIYSGFSNDQISTELDVAPTTIKTHIRNLYQKLQIANREQAINLADRLIKTINY